MSFHIIKHLLLFLVAARLETFMFENIPVDKVGLHNNRQSNFEYLGADMIEGGNEFGAGTPYGNSARKMFRIIKVYLLY